jgi:hypothetical protein
MRFKEYVLLEIDVTDHAGLSEAFLKRPNYFEVKVVIELLSTGIPLQPHS